MAENTAPTNRPAAPPTNLAAQRLGLALVLVILIVFGSEFTLSTLRRRTIQVSLRVNAAPMFPASGTAVAAGAAGAAPTLTPTPTDVPSQPAPTKTPGPAVVSITPRDQLLVDVQWNYRIGPRFQRATVHAIASIQNRVVAEGSVLIDCGSAVLECSGTNLIALNYTVPDTGNTGSGSQTVDWPVGDYVLIVESQIAELTPMPLQQMAFQVR